MYERVLTFATALALTVAFGCITTAQTQNVPPGGAENDATKSPARNQPNADSPSGNQSPAYPPISVTVTTPDKSPEAQEAEAQQRQREISAQEDIRDFTRALTWLAIVQAFITGLALLASFKAVTAAQKSADVAVSTLNMTHRPQLVVRHVVVEGFAHNGLLVGGALTNGYLWVTNAGVLPATLLKVHAEWLLVEKPPIENPALKALDTSTEPVVMAPASFVRINLPQRDITFEESTFINDNVQGIGRAFGGYDGKLFLVGYLKYQDGIGLRRRYFLFKYDTSLCCFVSVDEYLNYSYED